MDDKITIFDILARIDAKDKRFYDDLPPTVQKAEHPLVLMKWMAGTNDAVKTILLNELVNPYVFNLHKHKPLVMALLTACADGNRTRYKWTKLKKAGTTKYPILTDIIKRVFQYSTVRAVESLQLVPDAQLIEYAEGLGFQKDEMRTVRKEIKQRHK